MEIGKKILTKKIHWLEKSIFRFESEFHSWATIGE